MDPKVTREIIKTSEILKNKYRSLKRSLQDVEKGREEFFAPVLQPLEDIKQSVKLSNKEVKSETALTPRKVKRNDNSNVWVGSPEKSELGTSIYRKSTLLPTTTPHYKRATQTSLDETTSTALTPLSHIMSNPEFISPGVEEGEYVTDDPLSEQVKEYAKTPQGEAEFKEYLAGFGNLQREYLDKLLKGDKAHDSRYGIRVMPSGGMAIGDSTDVQLFANSDDISINGIVYEGTPGLLQLLYLKKPQDYTGSDLDNYKNILLSTNAHKKGYSEEQGVLGSRSEKYKNIISKLFPSQVLKPRPLSSASSRLTSLRSHTYKRGTGLMMANKPLYEYWNDPNELVDRLRLLMSSTNAGHEGHQNEIESIIEELREENIIY